MKVPRHWQLQPPTSYSMKHMLIQLAICVVPALSLGKVARV
jgi:hypothetical protein